MDYGLDYDNIISDEQRFIMFIIYVHIHDETEVHIIYKNFNIVVSGLNV